MPAVDEKTWEESWGETAPDGVDTPAGEAEAQASVVEARLAKVRSAAVGCGTRLTKHQRACAGLLACDLSDDEAQRVLGIAHRTWRGHVTEILDRTQLAREQIRAVVRPIPSPWLREVLEPWLSGRVMERLFELLASPTRRQRRT